MFVYVLLLFTFDCGLVCWLVLLLGFFSDVVYVVACICVVFVVLCGNCGFGYYGYLVFANL